MSPPTPTPAPSLSTLEYISREDLASRLRSSPSSSTTQAASASLPRNLAIIDVRDSDHIGGHIRGSTWIPSAELDCKMPELLRTLREKEVVVFHCALSQQRGPGAALRYLRERGRGQDGAEGQRVLVLRGGFTEWQEKYGRDEGLTEGWRGDIWGWGTGTGTGR